MIGQKTNWKTRNALKEATNAGPGPQLNDFRFLHVTKFNGIYTIKAQGNGKTEILGKVNGGTKKVTADNGNMAEALPLIVEYWTF